MSGFGRTEVFDERAPAGVPVAAVRAGVAASVVGLTIVGLLLVARRLAGALNVELPALHLVATAVVAGVIVFGGRYVWRRFGADDGKARTLEPIVGWGGSLSLVLMALGCSLGARGVDWLVWLPLVAADQWQLRWFLKGKTATTTIIVTDAQAATAGRGFMDECTGNVLQQLVRVREADGSEALYGTLRAEFARGQRHAVLHVGFCPPLERLPAVEAVVNDEIEAEVKDVQAFCHGVRLEVRLSEAAEEQCSVLVELSAKPQAASGEKDHGPIVPRSRGPL